MREMYHFFAAEEQIGTETVRLTGPDVNHMRNVLRMKPGEEILVSSKEGRNLRCRITDIGPEAVEAEILSADEAGTELSARLYLFQGLPKQDKMELVIQKAVELGAYQVIPVAARRCVVKLDAKKGAARVSRWNSIAESAAKQSKRSLIPEVTEIMTVKEALKYAKDFEIKMIPYENARGMAATKDLMEKIRPGMQVGIFIGPEGGFEESEVEEARRAGFEPVSLGKRILRTETAGLAALSMVMYHLETTE